MKIIIYAGLILLGISGMQMHSLAADTSAISLHTYTFKQVGKHPLKLDVYMPIAAGHVPFPVIILFHGGGWVGGKREMLDWQCRYFAKHGMVAVTADYRLVHHKSGGIDGSKAVCIMDAKSAIRWVKRHARKLNIDVHRVVLGGGSAGGHIATMAALDRTMNDREDDTTIATSANALVLFNPAYNIHGRTSLQPFGSVSSSSPPVIMFFGSRDKWKRGGDVLNVKLWEMGVTSELWIAEGQAHGFFNTAPWSLATAVRAHTFLAKLGLLTSEAPQMPPIPGRTALRKGETNREKL